MSSQFFGLNVGTSALYTYQVAINTTTNNIANVQTEGYSRQTTEIQATTALRASTKYGAVGTGVAATKVMQERDLYYDDKFWANNCKEGLYEESLYYLNQIETIFQDDAIQTGFTTLFSQMFEALDLVKNNASDVSIRNQFINQAQQLCTYFNSISNELGQIQEDCNEEIRNQANQINALGKKIATLNQQINVIEVNGGYANELRDQRANLIDELSGYVFVETSEYEIPNTYGENLGGTNFTVIINGQLLVDGNEYRELECLMAETRNCQSDIDGLYKLQWADTGMTFASTTEGSSGSLTALYSIRDGNNADNMKGTVSQSGTNSITINNLSYQNVNALNFPPEGELTIDAKVYRYTGWTAELDEEGNMTSITFESEEELTEFDTAYVEGRDAFCGKTVDYMGIPYYQNQINEFLRNFTEAFNNIEYGGETLSGEPMGTFFEGITKTGTVFDFDGWRQGEDNPFPTTLSSTSDTYYQLMAENVAVNQKSMKDPNYFAAADSITNGKDENNLVEKLMTLQDEVTMYRGNKASAFLETLLSDIAVDTQRGEAFYNNYHNLGLAIDNVRNSISGVDEDEEGVNLIKFQNAYNLASKIISILNEMYDKLINQTGV